MATLIYPQTCISQYRAILISCLQGYLVLSCKDEECLHGWPRSSCLVSQDMTRHVSIHSPEFSNLLPEEIIGWWKNIPKKWEQQGMFPHFGFWPHWWALDPLEKHLKPQKIGKIYWIPPFIYKRTNPEHSPCAAHPTVRWFAAVARL